MKLHRKIPFSEIESIPVLIKDFLQGRIPGFEDHIFSVENFAHKISEKSLEFSSNQRIILQKALRNQHSTLKLSLLQQKNLDSLSDSGTFTVTTGHQLNLFTGPVFFIYKILQTIKTAAYLKENFPQKHFIPMFWMATEDHDFEEINHFKTDTDFYEIKAESGGAVGRIAIEDTAFISEFEKEFQDRPFGKQLLEMMNEAYQEGNTLSEATRILVNRLFSDYGLLIIDGDDATLKKEMKDIFADEAVNETLFNHARENVQMLQSAYGKVQVNPREINLFYLTETRNRITKNGNQYFIEDTHLKFTHDEILKEIEIHPEKFSPNALLRPVYQEKILPNIAYIGGNAEIMYWLELKSHFGKLGISFPVLIPRNSMLFLSEKTLKKIANNGLRTPDFFKKFAEVIKEKLISEHQITRMLQDKENLIAQNFKDLKEAAEITDVTFGNLVAAEEKRQLKSFKRMKKRLLRAEKIKKSEQLARIEQLFLEIHPGKNWQERVYNFSVFYADSGRQWLETCLKEMDVQKSELIIMVN